MDAVVALKIYSMPHAQIGFEEDWMLEVIPIFGNQIY
jgi:hypothetical protein